MSGQCESMLHTIPRAVWILFIFISWTPVLQPVYSRSNRGDAGSNSDHVDCWSPDRSGLRVCDVGFFLCQDSHDCAHFQRLACVPCGAETFISTRNICAKCASCTRQCPPDREVESQPCNSTTDRVCECLPQYTRDSNNKCVTPASFSPRPVHTTRSTPPQKHVEHKPSTSQEQQPNYGREQNVTESRTRPQTTPFQHDKENPSPPSYAAYVPGTILLQGHHVLIIVVVVSVLFLAIILAGMFMIFVWFTKFRRGSNSDSQEEIITVEEPLLVATNNQGVHRTETAGAIEQGRPCLDLCTTEEIARRTIKREGCEHTEICAGSISHQLDSLPPSHAGSMTSVGPESDQTSSKRIGR